MTDDPFGDMQAIAFRAHVLTDRLGDLARWLFEEWRREGILNVTGAFVGDLAFDHAAEIDGIARMLAPDCPSANADNRSVDILLSDHLSGGVSLYCQSNGADYCSVELTLVRSSDLDLPTARAFQSLCVRVGMALMSNFRVYSARLLPVGPGLQCLPKPPLAESPTHLLIVTEQLVRRHYDDPAAFWDAGWAIAAEHVGQRLLTREMDLLAGPEYLERIIDHQWAMARAAKAGETGYDDPVILPEEEAVFRAGPARLEYVGYSADERLIEYSCALAEDQHIQGWEIYALRQIVKTKKTPDGKAAVETVRVVFMEESMAQKEKRPLLDVGCNVVYHGAAGKLCDLVD